jgi:2-C-methyl-D-erythritol 4-phosphate cytidylyltransferase
MRAAAVVLAAGSGTRVGAEVNKVLLPVAGVPVVARSLRTARSVSSVGRVVLVVREGDQDVVRRAVEPYLGDGGTEVVMVTGGATRHASEWQAFSVLAADIEAGQIDLVAVHDAARPLASRALWERVLAEAERRGGAIPVTPLTGLLHRDAGPLPERLAGVKTPQAFAAAELLAAYRRAEVDGFEATDTAGCLARYGAVVIAAVPSGPDNLKVTVADDFAVAEALVRP